MPSRTSEFRSCVESSRLRLGSSSGVPEHKQRLLAGGKDGVGSRPKSEFGRAANQIAREISATVNKLDKLAQLAKRKTLFDDRPVEISELTYIIKRDIASLNGQIAKLQPLASGSGSSSSSSSTSMKGKQAEEHNSNVLVMLQGKLATTSMTFKDILEIRTQNMKATKSRTEQFGYTNAGAASAPSGPSSDSVLYQNAGPAINGQSSSLRDGYNAGGMNGAARRGSGPNGFAAANGLPGRSATPDYKGKGRASEDHLTLDMGGPSSSGLGGGQEQMQMQAYAPQQQDQYLGQRATAIESIESTIQELGQIFTQLATMVAQQGETVQRIDADTSDIANNVSGAQRELLKYYASVSGNRALMLKVFGILIIFFLLFTLVT